MACVDAIVQNTLFAIKGAKGRPLNPSVAGLPWWPQDWQKIVFIHNINMSGL